ncbi:MAG: cation:proton antiporter [Myxococcales bacterium]|nr:cation:proton antiporter [Myxococcales bacterium]
MVLGVGAVTGLLAVRLKQPSILGYLLAGLLVGPYLSIPIFADPHRVETMSEFGVVLVMFTVGLELRLHRFLGVLPTAGATALVEVTTMLGLGYALGRFVGWAPVPSLFLGAGLCISSTMVVSRVFEEKGASRDLRDHVLGVLVVQDVLAITLAAVLTAVAAGGGLEASELARTLGKLGAVLVALVAGGLLIVPRVVRHVAQLGRPEALVVLVCGICFGLALLATYLGYSVALGAFLAGLLVAESGRAHDVEHLVAPLRDVFAAIFFVSIGMSVDPRLALEHLDLSLVATGVVIAGQLVVVGLAGMLSGNGLRRSLSSGLALGQIGEFAFILAAIGVSAGVVGPELQPVLVTVAVLTAFTTPIALGSADRLVCWVEHHLPDRLRTLLSLYEAWFQRLRRAPGGTAPRQRLRRALIATAIDGALLVTVVAVVSVRIAPFSARLRETLGVEPPWDRRVILLGAAAAIVPIALHLVLTSRNFGAVVAELATGEQSDGVRRLVQVSAQLLVLLGIGAPVAAAISPFVGATFPLPILIGLAAVGLLFLWRRAGELEQDVRSGAERVLALVARQAAEESAAGSRRADESRTSIVDGMLGLDSMSGVTLAKGSFAVGQTLADLDLRARTGASVVAILDHDGTRKVAPTGREVLDAGDTLVLAGADDSVAAAQRLLLEGDVPPDDVGPDAP